MTIDKGHIVGHRWGTFRGGGCFSCFGVTLISNTEDKGVLARVNDAYLGICAYL